MIEYVVMDYEGEPTVIENGEMFIAEPPYDCENDRRGFWNSEKLDWEFEPVTIYEESVFDEQMRYFYRGL